MRRLLTLAALAVFVFPVQAQMRSTGRGVPSPRGSVGSAGVIARGPGFLPRSGVPFRTFPGPFFPGRFHRHNRFFPGSFGSPFCGYPAGYSYPAAYYDYSYPASRYYPPLDYSYPVASSYVSNSDAQHRIESKLDRLQDRIDRFLDEQYEREQASASQAPSPQVRPAPSPQTSLVFRDQHIEQAQNYAIVGETLWVFTEDRARKVPLSELDLPATTKLNQEGGVEFGLPTSQ